MKYSATLSIKEFPDDNQLWWIRWFDTFSPQHRGTGTPGITVYLSPISDPQLREIENSENPCESFRLYQRNAPIRKVNVHATTIPVLTIGLLFRNKKAIRPIKLSSTYFSCDTLQNPQKISQSKEYHTAMQGSPNHNYRVLDRSEFALSSNWYDSYHCIVSSKTTTFLIPCPEVFRYFYSWNEKMAGFFTQGPWAIKWKDAISLFETGTDWWFLEARNGFKLSHCRLLAPLRIDEKGFERANDIYTHFLNKENPKSPSSIKAAIPFRDGPLKFRVRGLRLPSNKFIVFQILAHHWPYQDITLKPNIENDNRKGEIVKEINKKPPHSDSNGRNDDLDPTARGSDTDGIITSDLDPKCGRERIQFSIPEPIVEGIKEDSRPHKPLSFRYIKKGEPKPSPPGTEESSTGNSTSGKGGKRAKIITTNLSTRDRFQMLLNALDAMKDNGSIDSYCVVPSESGSHLLDGTQLWNMPKVPEGVLGELTYRPWAFLNRGEGKRIRTALVVEVIVHGRQIYLIELEFRSTQYRAIIFKPFDSTNVEEAINDVLSHAVFQEGRVGCNPEIYGNISFARGWKHYTDKDENGRAIGLKCSSLLGAMMEVVES